MIASSIVCTGMECSKTLRFLESLNVMSIQRREFSNLQQAYVIPAVFNVWKRGYIGKDGHGHADTDRRTVFADSFCGQFLADSFLRTVFCGQFFADRFLRTVSCGQFFADSFLRTGFCGQFFADSFFADSFFADSFLRTVFADSFLRTVF